MYYRVMKFALSTAYIALIVLTWKFFTGQLDWHVAIGCIALSGFWLVLTRLQMRHLLLTYFDTLSRLQVLVPLVIGVILSSAALLGPVSLKLHVVAGLEAGSWIWIYLLYRKNRRKYINEGHGPLPEGTWINPPADAIMPGDLILTSGRIASRLQESVGHGECAIRLPDGTMASFSSYMEKGAVINDLNWLCKQWLKNGDHYVVMRLAMPLTRQQEKRAAELAQQMLADNSRWRTSVNAWRAHAINSLPLPASLKNWLVGKTRATGYDWLGLFVGHLHKDHWTCVGACLELYHRLGIKTRQYGTGLLGLGTGLLDPIMPVRFLEDPAFRLLSDKDKETYDWVRGFLICDP